MAKLTIGMAHYEDFDGVWFTIQSLRLYHDLRDVELIVVDNSPETPAGKAVQQFVSGWAKRNVADARYVPLPDVVGTSVPRDTIFTLASAPVVLCLDCHVLVWPGAIERLIHYFDEHPDSRDLVTGPLVFDDLGNMSTHFDARWRGEMYGTWGQAWRCPCGGTFASLDNADRQTEYRTLGWPQQTISACPSCQRSIPTIPWSGHDGQMVEAGFQLAAKSLDDLPFEIPGNGLGLFACHKEVWPGFHTQARGFGGEELYVHEKIRRAGGRNLSLPFLRWVHRFPRPAGVKYPLERYAKVRNYVLEFQELGWDLQPIHDHFVGPQKMSEVDWQFLLADPVKHVSASPAVTPKSYGRPQPPSGADLDGIFDWAVRTPRDLDQHLPKLRELASQCQHVTELSKRRESTIGLLAGRPHTLVSYNIERDELFEALHAAVKSDPGEKRVDTFTTHIGADSLGIEPIAPTDLLFIDTVHHAERLYAELTKHGSQVRRWIVLRGTASFGQIAEGGQGPGLLVGMRKWQQAHPEWKVVYKSDNQYGLLVLSCDPAEPELATGPGTELHSILETLGITPSLSCDCRAKSRQMDDWGVEGCLAHRDEIIGWLRDGQSRWGWKDKLAAAARAVTTGLAFKLDPFDPFPSLVDHAIDRARRKQSAAKAAA